MTKEALMEAIDAIRNDKGGSLENSEPVNVIIEFIKSGYTFIPEEAPEPVKNADAESLRKLAARLKASGDREGENVAISAAAAILDYESKYHAARKNLLRVLKGERI